MPIQLFSTNTNQVTSFSHLETELIDPTRKLHIFSGIAIPAFEVDDDDEIDRVLCEVDLGVALPDIQQAAAQVGLASISNDDSAFVFAVDEARVEPHPMTGQLRLLVSLALMGDNSALSRFGFQVVVMAGVRATGVSGRVIWAKSLYDASQVSSEQVKTLLFVNANSVESVPGPEGGFSYERLNPLGTTIPQSLHQEGDDFWVPYSFDHLPLNLPIRITVGPLSNAFPTGSSAAQIHGPLTIHLSPGHLSESGVDFRITLLNVR